MEAVGSGVSFLGLVSKYGSRVLKDAPKKELPMETIGKPAQTENDTGAQFYFFTDGCWTEVGPVSIEHSSWFRA